MIIGTKNADNAITESPTRLNAIPASTMITIFTINQLLDSRFFANSNAVGNSENPQAEQLISFEKSRFISSYASSCLHFGQTRCFKVGFYS